MAFEDLIFSFIVLYNWNLGTPKFINEFMKHLNSYMKKSYECIDLYEFIYEFIYMNSYTHQFIQSLYEFMYEMII